MISTRTARTVTAFLFLIITFNSSLAVTANTAPPKLPFHSPDPVKLVGKMSHTPQTWSPSVGLAPVDEEWQAFRYEISGAVAMAVGSPIQLTDKVADLNEIVQATMSFVRTNSSQLNLGTCDLSLSSTRQIRNSTIVALQSEIDGVEVYGGFVVVSVSDQGRLTSVKARGYGSHRQGGFEITGDEALLRAIKAAGIKDYELNERSAVRRILFPQASNSGGMLLRSCYQVTLLPEDPAYRPVIFVDAMTGEILAGENRICNDLVEGNIEGLYKPQYAREESQQAWFEDERVRIDGRTLFSDEAGDFSIEVEGLPVMLASELRGRWVTVEYEDGANAQINRRLENYDPLELTWDEDNSRDDERNLFYHVNFIHDFWKELDENFDALDYSMLATCQHRNNYDNAYWNGQGIYFGGGGQMGNFAMFADVIYHEYGHAVTNPGIYRWNQLPYTGESGALNEAWSDYYPCSITDEPLVGEGGLTGGYLRNLDNNSVYPIDLQGEVHRDSPIVSGAMWHSREDLGRDVVDLLFHLARYRLGTDFLTYFTDVLITDDDNDDITDGTPNYLALYENFGRHGLGPGLTPRILITMAEMHDDNRFGADGNHDYLWEPGETIRIDLEVYREGSLFPPPAEAVRVTLTTDDEDIVLEHAEIEFGDMRVGDRLRGHQPLLFRIDDDTPLHFSELLLSVIDGEDRVLNVDTIRLALGRPELLLMRDGAAGEDRTEWFTNALDEAGAIYSISNTAMPALPLTVTLEQYKSVIWFTGDDREDILDIDSRIDIEYFLFGGGNLLLTGQSLDIINDDDWFADNLGTRHVVDSLRSVFILGVAQDPIGDSLSLLLQGHRGARNQRRPSGLEAVNNGVAAYYWERADGRPAAGIRRLDQDFNSRTVYLGFGLEGVTGIGFTASQSEALTRILNWFEVPNSVGENSRIPEGFTLEQAFPNPFNGTINVPFRLGQSGMVSMSIFDLNGRLVWLGQRSFGAGSSMWPVDASGWTSGSYIIRTAAPQGTGLTRITLTK